MNRLCGTCKQPLPEADGDGWEFQLSLEPPSQNKVWGNKGRGRDAAKYRSVRDEYVFLLRAWMDRLEIPHAVGRRRVFIVRLFSNKGQPRDIGNIIGGCKGLVDAMTNVGLLVDDKDEFFEGHYSQQRAPVKGVFLRIEEA